MVQLFYSQFMLFTITMVGKSGSITYPAATHTSENLIKGSPVIVDPGHEYYARINFSEKRYIL